MALHFTSLCSEVYPPAYSSPEHTDQGQGNAEGLHAAVDIKGDAKPSLWMPQ